MIELRAWCVPGLSAEPAFTASVHGLGTAGIRLRYPLLDAAEVAALVERLREARASLLAQPAMEVAGRLGAVGRRFLDEDDPLRAEALDLLPGTANISARMARTVLDGMAADWTPERLQALLVAEFGDPAVLDRFVPRPGGGGMRVMGPPLAVHLASGSVPGVSLTSLLRSLLVRSAVVLKPGRGDVVLPLLFARALAETDPELAAAVAVAYWPGGTGAAEGLFLAAADLAVVYGSDASVEAVRRRLTAHVPLVAYHHRMSVALVGRGALGGADLHTAAAETARAISVFDRRGCVSPQVVWVEEGGEARPRVFAEALAEALRREEEDLPPGPLGEGEASVLQQRRGSAEMLAAAGEDIEVWSEVGASWTVVYEGAGSGVGSGAARFVRVRPIPDADALPERLAPLASHLQSVAVTGLGERLDGVAEMLARVGVLRITPMSRAPWPPPWWHHDGHGPLRALVRHVELEGPG